jgi:hypothetical protein
LIHVDDRNLSEFTLVRSAFRPIHPLMGEADQEVECSILKCNVILELFGIPSSNFVGRTDTGQYFASETLRSEYLVPTLSHEYWVTNPSLTRPWRPARQLACEYELMLVKLETNIGGALSSLKEYGLSRFEHFTLAATILYNKQIPPADPRYEDIQMAADFWKRVSKGQPPHPAAEPIGR